MSEGPSPATTAVALATRSWGDGDRRALLVHGLTSDGGTWWRLGPALADTGYTVTAVDLRGHGDSPRTPLYSLDDYAVDLDALGQTPWDLAIGHSLGGAVVLAAASAGAFAGRIVVEDPWLVTFDLDRDHVANITGNATEAEIMQQNPAWPDEDVAAKAAAIRKVDPNIGHGPFLRPWDLRPALATIAIPTLLMGADPKRGALVSIEDGEAAATANPLVTYTLMSGFGHSIHREGWETYWNLVHTFAE